MKITTLKQSNIEIAVVKSDEVLVRDVQSALDFMATIKYETGCNYIILDKAAICEDFFDLKTKLAGDILQKFVNYHIKMAIVGDFSSYTSNSLKDFIYESNKGKDVFFLANEVQAAEKFTNLRV
ncbi:DUF4180 domain-containing protein [Desulfosporosinus sp. OT]|uniref:DUF4180 domain-containing protein n=1 Tax=Desulfosporosinus sp. OT TaxID=913865 RepID=UPI000223ABAF|nr:DUF4180 domain-containing protein [Desulfosporosinus sp. OT]EGW41116.1 alpha/beta hydrolase [Desulfosporosinus sp. OT]